jgi:type II secretory pathway component GspD/PulD (secretin)
MVILTPLFTAPGRTVPAGPVPPGAGLQGARIMADERTNQLLITGSPGEVDQVLEAIASVDVPAPAPDVSAHLIQLEHLNAAEAANELNLMIGASQLLWRGSDDRGAAPSVVASRGINALLVSAAPEAFEELRRLVQEMDERAGEPEDDGADK